MNMTNTLVLALISTLCIAGCGESGDDHDHGDGTHTHADGTVHKDGEHTEEQEQGSSHGELTELPAATVGEMKIGLVQAHGAIRPGKESHLIVTLPYNDNGATVVRAWIGTEDHTLSNRRNGDYAASGDKYDIHTMAPDPLPEKVMWWIEIEKPDGTKVVGSAAPLTD